MPIEILATIISVLKELIGLRDRFEKSERDRQDRIADYLIQISDCLKNVTNELTSGKVPHGSCAELGTYADKLPETIRGVVSDAEGARLAAELRSAHDVELVALQFERTGRELLKTQLRELEECCGSLRGLGNSLKARVADHH